MSFFFDMEYAKTTWNYIIKIMLYVNPTVNYIKIILSYMQTLQ